jgi:hypothetical protein
VEFDTTVDLKVSAVDNMEGLLSYWTPMSRFTEIVGLPAAERAEVREVAESYSESRRLTVTAAILAARNRLPEALAALDEAVRVCPGDTRARYMRAVILSDARWERLSSGHLLRAFEGRAQREIAQVLEEQIDDPQGRPGLPERYMILLRLAMARMLFQDGHGDIEATESQIRRVLAAEPESRIAQQFLQDLEQFKARSRARP